MDDQLRERLGLAAAGGAHGLAIWLLVESWPDSHEARAVAVAVLTFLAATALTYHFAWTGEARSRLLAMTAGTGIVYGLVAGWVGWSLPGEGVLSQSDGQRGATWFVISLATLYVLGPFLQIFQRTGRVHFPYRELFLHGWNNFFVALVGGLFVGALWTILFLWAALFDLIGIEFFEDMFSEEVFISVVTGGAAGFGVALGRESERVVSTLRGITLAVFRGLLPLVAFVGLIFLTALPMTGLDALWSTNHASQLLLAWVGVTVLFLNAVYQDGSGEQPLATPIQRLIEAALLAMAVFAAIAAYGISLRIQQHGLTPERFWGVLATVVLGGYAVGYAFAVLRRGEPWLRAVRAVNLVVALAIVSIGLLAHTPILDPIGWSARSQFDRLASGRVSADAFDYGFLRFQLGREGERRFEALEGLEDHPEISVIRSRMADARSVENHWEWQQFHDRGLGPDQFEGFPAGLAVPPRLLELARSEQLFWVRGACADEGVCSVFRVTLDAEAPDEWVVMVGRASWSQAFVFSEDADGEFTFIGKLHGAGDIPVDGEDLTRALEASRFQAVPPRWNDVMIGERRYRLLPEE